MSVNVYQKINIKELAERIADDLQINDNDIERLKEGFVPAGWSNAIIDNLTIMYNLEDKIIKVLLGNYNNQE